MKTKILLTALCCLLIISCSKNDDGPSLPPITQTGENTFGCFINGRLLVPRNGTGTTAGPDNGLKFIASGTGNPPNYDYNEINVQDFVSPNGGSIDIHIINLHENGEGNFEIMESNCERFFQANPTVNIRCRYFDGENYDYYCSIEGTGYLNISRYDYENRIVSGTFNFRARNENKPTDIIEITEGRFDIKWDELNNPF